MSSEIIQQLLQPAVQKFIKEHEQDDVKALLLKHSSIEGVKASYIAEQIVGRTKTKFKLPLYYNTPGIVFPPAINLEQCSSEATALLKAQHVGSGVSMVDLTGGLGVDTFFISKQFESAVYVEPDASLLHLSKHNHEALGAKHIEHVNSTAEEFLSSDNRKFDLVFIDPSRRNASQKVFKLADCIPDISTLQHDIFKRTDLLLVKASPLLDIQQGLKELQFVKDVLIVSVDGECKELLFVCAKGFEGEATLEAIHIVKGERQPSFTFTIAEEQDAQARISTPMKFLYEPNASILKAGAFKILSERLGLSKLHTNTHLYTSNTLVDDFPGRVFTITAIVKPEEKVVKSYFKDGKANVTTRNYPLSVDELKKKTRLSDGGSGYLIGFTGKDQKYVVVAERVQ